MTEEYEMEPIGKKKKHKKRKLEQDDNTVEIKEVKRSEFSDENQDTNIYPHKKRRKETVKSDEMTQKLDGSSSCQKAKKKKKSAEDQEIINERNEDNWASEETNCEVKVKRKKKKKDKLVDHEEQEADDQGNNYAGNEMVELKVSQDETCDGSHKKKKKRKKDKFREEEREEFVQAAKGAPADDQIKNVGNGKDELEVSQNETSEGACKKKKKRKNDKLVEEKKDEVIQVAKGTAALDYLNQWKNERHTWKYKKVRNVWILKNMYDSRQVNDQKGCSLSMLFAPWAISNFIHLSSQNSLIQTSLMRTPQYSDDNLGQRAVVSPVSC